MKRGYFGEYGGSFVPSDIQEELNKIEKEYNRLKRDKQFKKELNDLRKNYQGRPTPLYYCKKLTEEIGGAKIYLKREDLNHTGAHKINHCLGEALLAKHLGKTKVIAETGAGQHGVAIATACALMGLECEVHMGLVDVKKEAPNVQKMKLLGAKVVSVTRGDATLKDAVDSALESYSKQLKNSIYCIGSVVGPHPFPSMVRDFQSVIGKEIKKQTRKLNISPDYLIACIGGGSNAIGMFNEFLKDKNVKLVGVEAYGQGEKRSSAAINFGETLVYQGFKSKVLTNNGVVCDAYSIASGLDYPGVGPQHAYLNDLGRVSYKMIGDEEALDAFYKLSKTEGIIPALESSHAVAYAIKLAKELDKNKTIIVNLSGRGDKDCEYVLNLNKGQKHE